MSILDSKNSINKVCSKERLEKILNKICIFNLSFMERPITGRLVEISDEFLTIEQRDGRLLVARLDSLVGFGVAKRQPGAV